MEKSIKTFWSARAGNRQTIGQRCDDGRLGCQMKKFSFRSLIIFMIGLVVAVLLIGLGIAGVIKFKHRDISNTSAAIVATVC